ncbi:MAG: sulfotransferase domain-containing protein [Pseudomonadota bacterium]|nr:sulfotransferase domain-containing protein [Pseudomonadota bacterium]
MTDVILTGLPRSGATVVSALIDHLPQSVCLNSPDWHLENARRMSSRLAFCKWLVGDFFWQRLQLMRGEFIPDWRAEDGVPLLDGMHDPRQAKDDVTNEPLPISFTRPGLREGFILAMKHHTLYTALLPMLVRFNHFRIIAVIRNPLDVVASWQAMEKPPLRRGNPHGIARFWPEALTVMDAETNETDKFVQLYDLYLQRYYESREHIDILRYEDVVRDPGMVGRLFGRQRVPKSAKLIEPRNRMHSQKNVERIRASLKKYGIFTREYYADA